MLLLFTPQMLVRKNEICPVGSPAGGVHFRTKSLRRASVNPSWIMRAKPIFPFGRLSLVR
jgi:hypothetical protein